MTHHAPTSRARAPDRPHSLVHPNLTGIMMRVARESSVRGKIVEVGSYQGGTAWDLAELALEWDVELHLFDTFTGIPWRVDDDTHYIGDFGDTDVARVLAAVPLAHVHVGLFPDTLPPELGDIALVHADCDQYQSVLACIDHLGPRMLKGGLMFFDDFELPGCERAIRERGLKLECRYASRFFVTF